MITLKNISLEFLNQKIFNNLTQAFSLEDRVGIVGPNGAGKSTLLKVISGLQKLDSGSVLIGNSKIAYLPQEFVLNSNKSVIDEAFSGHHSGKLFLKEKELQEKLKSDQNQVLAQELLEVSNELSNYDVTKDLQDTKQILVGLGFSQKQLQQKVNELSVGWKMRLILGKLLLQRADFYMFDEPTNHLDISTKEWFLNFLKDSNIGFLLISHERYFLNKLCEKTLALQNGNAKMYSGNYDFFEQAKKEEIEHLRQAKIVQEKEILRKKETINRFRASASKAKMAQKMIKDLEKIEPIEIPPEAKIIRLSFDDFQKSSRHVLSVKNLSFGYEKDSTLFKNVTFEVERGQKVAIVAPNGKGKTTLFKVITQKLKPDNGSIIFDEKATYAIFEQDEHGSLNLNKSVFDEVNDSTSQSYEKVRSYLGAFLFDDESMQKKIRVLSGGEKNRVKLVKLLLQNTNLLLLDEPTNHLDIPSKDVLMKALQDFPGTILFVSHDRDFINKVATHVIDLKENSGHMYKGNYDEFLDQINEMGLNSEDKTNNQSFKNKIKSSGQNKNIKKEINKIEREIINLESKIKNLNFKFADLEYGTIEFDDAMEKLQSYEKELEELTLQWEEKI